MQDLLQQIDLDFYRWMRLLIVRAELDRLRQGHSASADELRIPAREEDRVYSVLRPPVNRMKPCLPR